ncbi:nitrite reductase small subunit NirD [Niallia sp. XMNu-256]|uniref:nitrite reductase small subunit NirD n=1 Tax=Niallia sp. XMNu-256 TaxID=3082444 RepID=UPI0030CC54D5
MANRVELGNYADFPVGIGQVYQFDKEEIALFRLSNGEVKAVENHSPHPKGGTLVDGLVSGEYIFCPVYDWKISLVDGKVQSPDEGQVKTYHIEVCDDKVYLEL